MSYRGHVQNGKIKLDEPLAVPEGTAVRVLILGAGNGKPAGPRTRRQIARMSIAKRRQILLEQSNRLAPLYSDDPQRIQWQGGDIVE